MDYDLYFELANQLESVRRLDLRGSPQVRALARFMHKQDIKTLPDVDEFVSDFCIPTRREFEESPHDQLTSEAMTQLIIPWVKLIRKEFFGSEEAPFENYEASLNWITKQKVGKSYPTDSPFHALCEKADEITKATCFTSSSVLGYILCNDTPIMPKVILRGRSMPYELPTGETITNAWMSVVIIQPDLSFQELLTIHKQVKGYLGCGKRKRFKEEHLKLYKMVTDRGGAPTKGVVAFWESLKDEWNKKHGKKQRYQTWKGIKIAYDRMARKLSAHHRVENQKTHKLTQLPPFEPPDESLETRLRRELDFWQYPGLTV